MFSSSVNEEILFLEFLILVVSVENVWFVDWNLWVLSEMWRKERRGSGGGS